ncbi:hypothetical protein HNR33_003620 [Brassicibacter mesophilus]
MSDKIVEELLKTGISVPSAEINNHEKMKYLVLIKI